ARPLGWLEELLVAHEKHYSDLFLPNRANHFGRIVERLARPFGFAKDEDRVYLRYRDLKVAIPVAGCVSQSSGRSHARQQPIVLSGGGTHRVRVTVLPVKRVEHEERSADRRNLFRVECVDVNAGHAGRRLLDIRARLGTAVKQRLLW